MTTRHLLADDDLTQAEQLTILDIADEFKANPYRLPIFAGPRSVAVLFDKPTLRTQVSFAAAIAELGGFPLIVDGRLAGIGVRESVADTARVLGRHCVAIVWRTFVQDRLGEMAAHAGDGANNMAHSYALGGARAGMHVRIGAPVGFQPDPDIWARAKTAAAGS